MFLKRSDGRGQRCFILVGFVFHMQYVLRRIFLKRTESILKLFIEVEKLTGIKDLEIFDGEELIEDDRRTLDEHGFFPFANLIVKLPE